MEEDSGVVVVFDLRKKGAVVGWSPMSVGNGESSWANDLGWLREEMGGSSGWRFFLWFYRVRMKGVCGGWLVSSGDGED